MAILSERMTQRRGGLSIRVAPVSICSGRETMFSAADGTLHVPVSAVPSVKWVTGGYVNIKIALRLIDHVTWHGALMEKLPYTWAGDIT